MRMRTSQNVGVELSWTIDIVGVVAGTGEKPKVLLAPHRSADDLAVHRPLPRLHPGHKDSFAGSRAQATGQSEATRAIHLPDRTYEEHHGSEFKADDDRGGASVPGTYPDRPPPGRARAAAHRDDSLARRKLRRERLGDDALGDARRAQRCPVDLFPRRHARERVRGPLVRRLQGRERRGDRKSTRLNSSHVAISY